ncbi:MAG: hypothetical protein EOP11_21560 [Proteobacteria bacterium]|nr:MAG: hypothetical protein EOP11_21560 [Pseudomonadota bacterium]
MRARSPKPRRLPKAAPARAPRAPAGAWPIRSPHPQRRSKASRRELTLHPILFHFLGYPVKTYGVFVSLAHLAGILGVLFFVRRRGYPLERFVDLIFVVLLSGLTGGRLGYWLGHPGEIQSVGDFFALDRGGLSFFGGLSLAFPAYLFFLYRQRLPVWEISDLLSPVLPLSLAILRLGCFGAGCCYGTATELPWAVHPLGSAIGLHPSQLYESGFLFLLSGGLVWLNARARFKAGLVASFCMGAYGLYRLLFDSLRGDMEHGWPGGLSSSQVLGLALFGLALATAAFIKRAKRRG